MGNLIPSFSIILLSDFLLFSAGCKNNAIGIDNKRADILPVIEEPLTNPNYVKFRTFQNADSTWGYTVFLNSRPYIHYSTIPFRNTGFTTKQDAETVAGLLVKMIQKGDMSPRFDKKLIDSLELRMKVKEKTGN